MFFIMKSELRRSHQPFAPGGSVALLVFLLLLTSTIVRADAVSDLAAFSAFDKVDLAELAKSEVKTVHGPPMSGRFLSVQSCYVAPGSATQQIEALRQWDPTKHRELKVFLHSDLPRTPSGADFAKLQ